jgi:superfamily II DNA or RNA helicase
MTELSTKGYKIPICMLDDEDVSTIREELTVKPYNLMTADFQGANAPDTSFSVFKETTNGNFYLPKSYGLKHFGVPDNDVLKDSIRKISVEFNGTLRKEQEAPVSAFLTACHDPEKRGGIISLQCAAGKCLAKDTEVLMYDGTVQKVQDVKTQDRIMGDDSTPRVVMSTCTGMEEMYDIIPDDDMFSPYTVNKSHVLSLLKRDVDDKWRVCDISVNDFVEMSFEDRSKYRGYCVQVVECSAVARLSYDPYRMGLGLHMGNFTTQSVKTRLEFLAGVIDSAKYYRVEDDVFMFSVENVATMKLSYLKTLINSLGFSCRLFKESDEVAIKNGIIPLTSIPVHSKEINDILHSVAMDVSKKVLVIDNKYLTYSFKVIPQKIDEYYGFEIDGNRRFLLGDCTVTHNTVMALYLSCQLSVKTLVVVHKEFLLNQWQERISQFVPNARVGFIKGPVCDVENKDIVIGSLQSLSMKKYPRNVFEDFGFVIYDEVHHCAAQVFSKVFYKVTTQYTLGLSATVNRKDGLTKVFKWHIGDIVYKNKKSPDTMKVVIKEYFDPCHEYSRVFTMFNNKPNMSKMINNICEYLPRVSYVVDCLEEFLDTEKNRKVLILSDRRNHLALLGQELGNRGISWGFYYGGLKQDVLQESEKQQVLLGTFAYVSEGFDMKGLNTLILASPKSDIIQSVGRILRDRPEERMYQALVIDVVDMFSLFPSQAKKRLKYYESQKYEIVKDLIVEQKDVLQDYSLGICRIKIDDE